LFVVVSVCCLLLLFFRDLCYGCVRSMHQKCICCYGWVCIECAFISLDRSGQCLKT
jgi:hypothetical protein